MAVKMRHNKDSGSKCCSCGTTANNALGMYDLKIGGHLFTICDMCNKELLNKTLKAEVENNHRTKSPRDMKIIRRRINGIGTGGN